MSLLTEFWPFWLGGAALAAVAVGFPALLRRGFGVTTAFERVLDPLRGVRAASAREEGGDAVGPASDGWSAHAVFIGSIAVGGFLGALAAGRLGASSYDGAFARVIAEGPFGLLALALGGLLVGFGTRMAGGCTSGHGLTGCSRAQPGSLLATATFFGTGVLVSLLLEWVRS